MLEYDYQGDREMRVKYWKFWNFGKHTLLSI